MTAKMTIQATKIDPIREKFYAPIETAEKRSSILFGVIVALSFATVLFDETSHKKLNTLIQWIFLVTVITSFALDHWIRLFLAPRGQDYRAQDFLTKAYGAPLGAEQTSGYYNNNQRDPARKIAAQVFENSLFSKEITSEMLKATVPLVLGYVVLWLAALANRDVPIPIVAACAQIVFGEQILSRCLRLFWMNRRFENTYAEMNRLFLSRGRKEEFSAMALESYTKYEATKALGGITLSSRIFDRLNPRLSEEWAQTCRTLAI